jgi:hypothetical protein
VSISALPLQGDPLSQASCGLTSLYLECQFGRTVELLTKPAKQAYGATTAPIGSIARRLGVTSVESGLMQQESSAGQLHSGFSRSRRECVLHLHAAAESSICDVRIFGGVWYEILHTSGGLPKRLLRAA